MGWWKETTLGGWAHSAIYRGCIVGLYTWNLYNVINQCCPRKLKNVRMQSQLSYSVRMQAQFPRTLPLAISQTSCPSLLSPPHLSPLLYTQGTLLFQPLCNCCILCLKLFFRHSRQVCSLSSLSSLFVHLIREVFLKYTVKNGIFLPPTAPFPCFIFLYTP